MGVAYSLKENDHKLGDVLVSKKIQNLKVDGTGRYIADIEYEDVQVIEDLYDIFCSDVEPDLKKQFLKLLAVNQSFTQEV